MGGKEDSGGQAGFYTAAERADAGGRLEGAGQGRNSRGRERAGSGGERKDADAENCRPHQLDAAENPVPESPLSCLLHKGRSRIRMIQNIPDGSNVLFWMSTCSV